MRIHRVLTAAAMLCLATGPALHAQDAAPAAGGRATREHRCGLQGAGEVSADRGERDHQPAVGGGPGRWNAHVPGHPSVPDRPVGRQHRQLLHARQRQRLGLRPLVRARQEPERRLLPELAERHVRGLGPVRVPARSAASMPRCGSARTGAPTAAATPDELLHPGRSRVLLRPLRPDHRRADLPAAEQRRARPFRIRLADPGRPVLRARRGDRRLHLQLLRALRATSSTCPSASRSPSRTRSRSTEKSLPASARPMRAASAGPSRSRSRSCATASPSSPATSAHDRRPVHGRDSRADLQPRRTSTSGSISSGRGN